jgi:hypothetical protein
MRQKSLNTNTLNELNALRTVQRMIQPRINWLRRIAQSKIVSRGAARLAVARLEALYEVQAQIESAKSRTVKAALE